jgi:hypothetical protein
MAKSKSPRRKRVNRLKELYAALEEELTAQLEVRRVAHRNAEAKGEASEDVWIELLAAHLPYRYQVTKGIVIDANGRESHYIDVIIYDRQYTPLVFNKDGKRYIPAESVYAVIEAKQTLTRANIVYAGKKAASVRRLHRTSAPIVHAGGTYPAVRKPFPIIAGVVSYASSWTEPLGTSLEQALRRLTQSQRLDFGVAADHGYFEVRYEGASLSIKSFLKTRVLAAFMIRLLARLQRVGTVTAIDYTVYSKILEG